MLLTRDEIVSLGPVDDTTIGEIAETGATLQDLRAPRRGLGQKKPAGLGQDYPPTDPVVQLRAVPRLARGNSRAG